MPMRLEKNDNHEFGGLVNENNQSSLAADMGGFPSGKPDSGSASRSRDDAKLRKKKAFKDLL